VTVLEAAPTIGGGTRTAELTLPGLLHDECSGFHPLGVDTALSRHLDLGARGLDWRWPEVQYTSPLDESGRGGAALRSCASTAAGLDEDAGAWLRLFGPLDARFGDISEDFLGPLLRIPGHPLQLARFGLPAALPAGLLARSFVTPEARTLWAGVAAHAFRPLGSPFSSAIGVALGTAAHTYGWPVAAGGSRAITDALARVVEEHNGRIETGVTVTSVDQLGPVDLVMLDTSPGAALGILGDRIPAKIARAYRRYRHGPGAFKVEFAVHDGVPWVHEPSRRAGTVHVCGSYEEVARAESAIHHGRMPERPFVLVGQQYLADPQRSNADVHPVYSYAHVPAGYTGDATEAIVSQIERFAPGFSERIAATHVTTTSELSRSNANYVGGDIVSGSNDLRQLLFRPRMAIDPYATGAVGVYLCSAATPPGAGAHGMCGFNAARAALASVDRRLDSPS
jgi:phytoene dehydrogenase-like protein